MEGKEAIKPKHKVMAEKYIDVLDPTGTQDCVTMKENNTRLACSYSIVVSEKCSR